MSTANDLKAIFPNNAGGTCTCNQSKLFERLKIRNVIMIIECEVSFTPPNVYDPPSSRGTNSEPFAIESHERNFERT